MKHLRLILASCLALTALSAYADHDFRESQISLINMMSAGGYVEIRFPFYDDKNADEGLASGWESDIRINGSIVMEMKALSGYGSYQSEGDSYWCKLRPRRADTAVEYKDGSSYKQLTGETQIWSTKDGTTSYSTVRVYPSPDMLKTGQISVLVRLITDEHYTSDYYTVTHGDVYSYTPPVVTPPTVMLSADVAASQCVTITGRNAGDRYAFESPADGNPISGTFEHAGDSFTFPFHVQNEPRTLTVKQWIKLSKYQEYPVSSTVNIPAYFLPSMFTATFNEDANVDLYWVVDASSYDRNNQDVNGQWELQRDVSPDFNNPKKLTTIDITKDNAKIIQKTEYRYTDKTSQEHLNGKYYYRLRRVGNNWGWDPDAILVREIELKMEHKYVANPRATAVDNAVTVTWDWDGGQIWSERSQVYYIRTNTTRHQPSAPMALSEDEVSARMFFDELPTVCDVYSYTMYVVPGSASYAKQEELGVESSYPLYNLLMGDVVSINASKGYFSDRVELNWTTDGQALDMFSISARPAGSEEPFRQVGTVTANASAVNYSYNDNMAVPGVIYEYLVNPVSNCGDQRVEREGLKEIGFRAPTGEINGRITFQSGQAEEGVTVEVTPTDGGLLSGKAMSIVEGGSMTIENRELLSDCTEFTLQAWINPGLGDGTIMEKSGMFKLALIDHHIDFKVLDEHVTSAKSIDEMLVGTNFIHVSAVAEPDSLALYVDGKLAIKAARTHQMVPNRYPIVMAEGLNCILDDVRIWNQALSASVIHRDYNRYLAGNETGLVAYYTFDTSVDGRFFDSSYIESGTKYNGNHGVSKGATAQSYNIPSVAQLAHRGVTNASGIYIVRAIPYSGNGTSYEITPRKSINEFIPTQDLRYISAASPVHTVNFVDNSSFKVSGIVTYEGGDIPVEGVSFEIDGVVCKNSKNQVILSDEMGRFSINVPAQVHEVRAVKEGHTFANDGRITNSDGTDRDYQDIVTGLELIDQTKIKFVGRLAGGPVQQELPVGFGVSTNNLGNATRVKLRYINPRYVVASEEHTDEVLHIREGFQGVEYKTNTVNYRENIVTIYPNVETGEFVAYIPPVKYAITIDAPGYEAAVEQLGQEKDFSTLVKLLSDTHEYTDSVTVNGVKQPVKHTETLTYHARQNFPVRVAPEIEVRQMAGSTALPYFGEDKVDVKGLDQKKEPYNAYDDINDVYTIGGRPVFFKGKEYKLRARVHECYRYYDSLGDEIPNHEPDLVASQNAVVSFICNTESKDPVVYQADENGVAYHTFVEGDPEVTSGTNSISISAKVGEDGVAFPWTSGSILNGYITLGARMRGNTFVTQGPNKILTVLRDPPGSKSYAWLEEGAEFKNYTTYSGKLEADFGETNTQKIKSTLDMFNGVSITENVDIELENAGGMVEHGSLGGSNSWESKLTITKRYETSSDPEWVGSPADLFIGTSNNIVFGETDNLTFITRDLYQELYGEDTDYFSIYEDLTPATSDVILVRHDAIGFGDKVSTIFAYTQQHIENVLIPNLQKNKLSLLHQKGEMSAESFLALAASEGKPVYVSNLAPNHPNYGKSNSDKEAFGDNATTTSENLVVHGPSYDIYYPPKQQNQSSTDDDILDHNQWIAKWIQALSDNEKAKVEAVHPTNWSFQAGAQVNYSESYEYQAESSFDWDVFVGFNHSSDTKNLFGGVGCVFKFEWGVKQCNEGKRGSSNGNNIGKGFVLADDGGWDYLSVDVLRENVDYFIDKDGNKYLGETKIDPEVLERENPIKNYNPGFVFRTRAGMTSCPYEGREVTKYYQPGTLLNEATTQLEVPSISVENAFVDNVPSGEAALVKLYLRNNSEMDGGDNIYDLKVIDASNPDGLQIQLDGGAIGNGRSILVPQGQTVEKTLICRKAGVLNYDNIKLALVSQCQNDPTSFIPVISDEVVFSVHFTPSATDVNIRKPAPNWIYNTKLPTIKVDGVDKHYMAIELNNFDINYDNFYRIRLQTKPSSASDEEWSTLIDYYADENLYNQAVRDGMTAHLINADDRGVLRYNWMMDDMMDQNYDLRAVGTSMINNVEYTNPSAVHTGIKDMYNPRLFGQPQPADGILGVEDEIRLNFNETIADGYLKPSNFSVTGIRNGSTTTHSTSVLLDGINDLLCSEASRNLSDKDLTVEMWVNAPEAREAVWFNHGGPEGLSFGITADNHMKVKIGDYEAISPDAVKFSPDQWAHVSMIYDKEGFVNAYYNYENCIDGATLPRYEHEGKYAFGGNTHGEHLFQGKIHGARIWDAKVLPSKLKVNSTITLSGREANLMAYYPMDEGRGNSLTDKAHSATLAMGGAEWALPAGRAAYLDGTDCVRLSTGTAVVDSSMDYTMEMWFKGDNSNSDAVLLSNGTGEERDQFCLGFENGVLTFTNNNKTTETTGNWLDDNWHHVAVAVSRTNGRGQICIDGELNSYFPTENVGGIGAAYAWIGARGQFTDPITSVTDRFFKGYVDDVRLWNTYRNEDLILEGNNRQLLGDEMGLMAYYPFEHYITWQGTPELQFSLADANIQSDPDVIVDNATVLNGTSNAVETNRCAPVKGTGEVSKLQYDWVVNNDALIINLNEDLNRIENTIVTFSVNGIRDLNGNEILNPITWTAYIDRNQLKWGDDKIIREINDGEVTTFNVDVVNSGGRNLNYRISNLPGWLTASKTSGKITPASRETITFTITDAVAIGSYNEYIYLTGDNDVNETLQLNLKVNGTRPDWSVDPGMYDFSMNVFGKIKIDGRYSSNVEDIVAAFDGGKCVGVATNTYVPQNDSYMVMLTIYSDVSKSTKPLKFNIWDASTGRVCVATTDSSISFENNTVVGTIEAPVVFSTTDMTMQEIDLGYGWNWISFNVDDNSLYRIEQALYGYTWGANDFIKSEADNQSSFHMNGGWYGALESLSYHKMYHIYTEHPKTMRFTGASIPQANTLKVCGASDGRKHWTYLPYWPTAKLAINEAMSGYQAASGDILKGQTQFAVYSSTLGWVGNLSVMEPGRGYMLQRVGTDDVDMTYPGVSRQAPRCANTADSRISSLDSRPCPGNMTMIATTAGIELLPGDRIVALASGERRGSAEMMTLADGTEVIFLTVAGDKEGVIDIAVERDDETVAIARNAVGYNTNAVHGTVESPFVIDFERNAGVDVFPTLFRDNVNINVNFEAGSDVEVRVHDVNGHLLSRMTDSTDAEGSARLTWDGSSLPKGFYILSVTVDGECQSFKLVKE